MTAITTYGESADHRDAGDISFGPFDMLHEEGKLSCIQRSIIGNFRGVRVAAAVKICQQLGGVGEPRRTQVHTYHTKGHDSHAMQELVPRPSKLMKGWISRE